MADSYTNPVKLPPAPNGWRVAAIEELCSNVTSGGTPLRSNRNFYFGGTHSWFKTQELRDCVLIESEEKITDQALQKSSAKLFPKDTVLMAMYGDGKTITSLGILAREAATNQACCAMIPNIAVCHPRFLYYALKHHREDFIRIATGGAQRNLSGKLIRRFAINTPPIHEQQEIAKILGALDEKIELNRKMSETLEAMARAIFKAWFMDFEPVYAKQRGESARCSQSISELFPSAFENSALGAIPQGWKVATVGSLVDTISDTYPLSSVSEVIFLNTGDILRGRILHREKSPANALPGQAKKSIKQGDILYSEIRPGNMRFAYVYFDASDYVVSTKLMVLRSKTGVDPLFPYFLLTAKDKIDFLQMMAESRSGTFPQITFAVLSAIEIVLPPPTLVQRFVDQVLRPAFERKLSLDQESETLISIRDTLLPKLLSGDVRLKEAEQAVESVV